MNVSALFIRRPVGTTLLALALFLLGMVAYFLLPVASLPAIDLPVVSVFASRPGADPATMAATVAAPLERRLAGISSMTGMTSSNSLGSTQILLQFDLDRKIDSAARDVQAAINTAAADLPTGLPIWPFYRKVNSTSAPVLVLALTSETLPTSAIYDAADTVIAQRISQVAGVAQVRIAGAEQPAIRVQVDPPRLAAMHLGLDQVANAIVAANAQSPLGAFDGGERNETIAANDQLLTSYDFREVVVSAANGVAVKLKDVATIDNGVRNRLAGGWFNGKPAVLLVITKQPNANVIETVDHIKDLLPELQRWIPRGIDISILSDRTQTIRSSIHEIQLTLFISICLVMAVVFLFLRRATPTLAAAGTVPLSLVGTCAAMWAAGFSLDNLSLMALTISVGLVVDDAIVMIETIERNIEGGMGRMDAAILGSKQVGFTIISLSLSIIAVFIPLLFMGGIVGRALREFSVTLSSTVVISTIVSLTVTPMICARFGALKTQEHSSFAKSLDTILLRVVELYARSLRPVIDHPRVMFVVIASIVALTIYLYGAVPKGNLPQDDIGLINGTTETSADASFAEMVRLQKQAADVLMADPDVANVGSFVGGASSNQGQFFVALKARSDRESTSVQVVNRLREELAHIAGLNVFLIPVQDLSANIRPSKSQFQFTLSDSSLEELDDWVPQILTRLRRLHEITDVSTDRQQGGLKANVVIDRATASRMGVGISAIDAALNSAFGQRQDAILYTQRNQYRVVLEAPLSRQADPQDLSGIYVSSSNGTQVPLLSLAHIERASMPLIVNHQGVVSAVTITYNLAPGATLDAATNAVQLAVAEMGLPGGLRADFAGDAANFRKVSAGLPLLIAASISGVYIILGILYESLIHPITIISTLPSAGLGALLALELFGVELTVIAFIGILLLIGIVKKNGIILIDFALRAERERGLPPHDAALEAATERFRPILMTTLAAIFGALPLAFSSGIGAELRRPLGITIIGGLLVSQVLTLYTTPIIYLWMSKVQTLALWRKFKKLLRKTAASSLSSTSQ